MTQLSKDIIAYSRACERLLSTEVALNDEESRLVAYYFQELSRKVMFCGATIQTWAPVQPTQTETA
jgi:hypothetical protein